MTEIGPVVLAIEGSTADECLAAIHDPKGLRITTATSTDGRWSAILAALRASAESTPVVVHHPDHPLVPPSAISHMLRQSRRGTATVAATPVVSSVKRVLDGLIVETMPRDTLHVVQSPWVFDRETLEAALRLALAEGWPAGNELELVRRAGIPIRIAEGHLLNIVVASRADARFAEMAVGRELVSLPGRLTGTP